MIGTLTAALGLGAHDPAFWMPLAMMVVLMIVLAAGVLLDGFDLGVGCLTLFAPQELRLRMLSLLSPWRDANEFWLIMGLGLFLAAFPNAVQPVMDGLYLPLTLLALGTLLRSVAFEFRMRSSSKARARWLGGFALGALMVATAHGLLLARVVTNFEEGTGYDWFALFVVVCVFATYCLLGATWLIMRVGGELRARALVWGRRAVRWAAAGTVGVSVVLGFANPGVLIKWSDGLHWSVVALLWSGVLFGFVVVEMLLQRQMNHSYRTTAIPFLLVLLILLAMLGGLAYSFFPYIVLDNVTLWDGAASVASLRLLLSCIVIALPVAVIFNVWVYWRMFGLSIAPEPPRFRKAD
ncbi:cytochrome d ubiquinol oxidase subunit II [Paracandidimonas soli]|uniref:cytochrome d ubiquinol oxidase subunit II n=1 Tax=Paracandidimonas soli TaxID=1917182 RepID=UPI00333E5C51